MSPAPETNVDRHRRAVEAYNARDIEALIPLLDREIEFHSTFAAAFGAVYRGHDGVRRWHHDIEEAWAETRLEPEAYFDLEDRTLAYFVYRGRGRESGAEVAMPIAQLVTWREGRAAELRTYTDREEALAELNLAAADLDPIEP